jgi:hypothetical protein
MTSEMLVFSSTLTQMIAQEDFRTFIHPGIFKSYVNTIFFLRYKIIILLLDIPVYCNFLTLVYNITEN